MYSIHTAYLGKTNIVRLLVNICRNYFLYSGINLPSCRKSGKSEPQGWENILPVVAVKTNWC